MRMRIPSYIRIKVQYWKDKEGKIVFNKDIMRKIFEDQLNEKLDIGWKEEGKV